jgi:hypothetical protein
MKSWNAQKTTLAERLADGRRYASGKTIEVVDLPNLLEAVFRPATASVWRATTENKRTSSPLRSPTSILPRSTIFIRSSQVSRCPSTSIYSRRVSHAGSIIPIPARGRRTSP